ncbi:MAG: sigma-70 family RNA polymerase sigma factor [Myxococcota bacterium]
MVAAEVVEGALAGDPRAADALLRSFGPQVCRWCARLGGPRIDVEAAAQEVLLVVHRRLPELTHPQQVAPFVFQVVRRVVANERRRAWLRWWAPMPAAPLATGEPGPEAAAEQAQRVRIVWEVVAALPADQREVLVLVDLEERTAPEAAALLGIPEGTVRSRLRVARQRFRERLLARGLAPAAIAEAS